MQSYNEEYETIMEKYGMLRTVMRERFPSKLKLSQNFIQAFHEEFKSHTSPTIVEDGEGGQTETPGRNRHTVLREFQKALKFLSKGI